MKNELVRRSQISDTELGTDPERHRSLNRHRRAIARISFSDRPILDLSVAMIFGSIICLFSLRFGPAVITE